MIWEFVSTGSVSPPMSSSPPPVLGGKNQMPPALPNAAPAQRTVAERGCLKVWAGVGGQGSRDPRHDRARRPAFGASQAHCAATHGPKGAARVPNAPPRSRGLRNTLRRQTARRSHQGAGARRNRPSSRPGSTHCTAAAPQWSYQSANKPGSRTHCAHGQPSVPARRIAPTPRS